METKQSLHHRCLKLLGWLPKYKQGYSPYQGPDGNEYPYPPPLDHNLVAELRERLTQNERILFEEALMNHIDSSRYWDCINSTPLQQAQVLVEIIEQRGK
jgi:hypothetical protein